MRYVIVCLIKGEALAFHENHVSKICSSFNVKRQRLPAHFTIKAPFEIDDISEIESLTENFCSKVSAEKILIDGFGHFRDTALYMAVHPSKNAVKIYDDYIDLLKAIKNLEWKSSEGGKKDKFY